MSDFPYDSIAEYQKWTSVSAASDRGKLFPQGPPKFRLSRDTIIGSAGSCFAERIAERLPALGLSYPFFESDGPYSARFGNIYTSLALAQLFARAFGTFDPVERYWSTARGRFVDPFRPLIDDVGFATIDELEADRAQHLAAVRRMFTVVDLFVFTLGLAELWQDTRDGAAYPSCPGRGLGVFDPSLYSHRLLDVAENVAALETFLAGLREVNPAARVLLTISPVFLAATMLPMHVARATLLAKATLKVAAETIARSHENVEYFAVYDYVNLDLGGETLYAPDGRNVLDSVADRVTATLDELYFEPAVLTNGHSAAREIRLVATGDVCDEDRLLSLVALTRPASNGSVGSGSRISRPTPLFFFGASSAAVFNRTLYDIEDEGSFIGIGMHARAFHAHDFTDESGRLNDSVLHHLLAAEALWEGADGRFIAATNYDVQGTGRGELFASPPLTVCFGGFDLQALRLLLSDRAVRVPADVLWKNDRLTDENGMPFEEAVSICMEMLAPFERGLALLQSYGFANVAVQMVTPIEPYASLWTPDDPQFDAIRFRGATYAMNAALQQICTRSSAVFLDCAAELLNDDGARMAEFVLDNVHLNEAGSAVVVRRLLSSLRERSVFANA